jgi:hypothetical protein
MVMRFRSGGAPSGRFHVGGLAPLSAAGPVPVPALMQPADAQPQGERTTWFTSSLELREGCEVQELTDDSIDRIVL